MSSSSRSSSSRSSRTARKPFAIGAGVAVAALLLGYASYTATRPDSSPASSPAASSGSTAAAEVSSAPQSGSYPELEKLARRDAKDPLAVGRADAPVVLIEYADFQCNFCGKFARDTEPELVKKYVDEGILRIEWRNFSVYGEVSEAAARAAWAAGQQGRFPQFHATAYAEGSKEKGFAKDRLASLARDAGVKDLDRFRRDLDSEGARQAVAKDQEEAYGIGVTSTPSFLINGRPIAGAQPTETFTEAIEAAQKAAEQKAAK